MAKKETKQMASAEDKRESREDEKSPEEAEERKSEDGRGENDAERQQVLSDTYYDFSSPGGLSSPAQLKAAVQQKISDITNKEVLSFLEGQRTFTLHRRRHDRFPSRQLFRLGQPFETCGTDLLDISAFSAVPGNKNKKFICVFVCLFSNYKILVPLTSKSAAQMRECIDMFLKAVPAPYQVAKLWSDRGRSVCLCVCL